MPIQDKDLGRYKRAGIFINEIDQSIIELPIQDVLVNLVPGFSRKGPVNRPVLVNTKVDFITIYGDIDKSLERKGSYFHRTCLKMLESGPIWALNLLITDDNLDLINYKTISCASNYTNEATKTMPYTRVFNRQDFWTRDDEAFLDYINDPTPETDKILHITNLGDKTITVFIYKSDVKGFDVTAEQWYGGKTKVPSYIHYLDWVSDYMVSVLILGGDWTDYNTLSTDTTWGQYFDTTGLQKDKIQDFVNETNVEVFAFYDASLIPYFKDITGRDMYIKNIINNNTDKTGLFCAFFEDELLDSDYPTGKIDVIGDGLVGEEKTSIDFLSYKETIIENITYSQQPLDEYSNVFGNYGVALDAYFASGDTAIMSRIASKTNWYITGADTRYNTAVTFLSQVTSFDSNLINLCGTTLVDGDIIYFNTAYDTIEANTSYYVIGNGQQIQISTIPGGSALTFIAGAPTVDTYVQMSKVEFDSLPASTFNLGGTAYTFSSSANTVYLEPLTLTSLANTYERCDVLYLSKGNNAVVNVLKGTQEISGSTLQELLPSFTLDYNDYIILGYVHIIMSTASTSIDYTGITLDADGYMPLKNITASGEVIDGTKYVKLTFGNTLGGSSLTQSVSTDYNKIRTRAAYNEISSNLEDEKGVIINHKTGEKYYIENPRIVDYSRTNNASIRIPVGTENPEDFFKDLCGVTYEWLLYYVDNEFFIQGDTKRLVSTTMPVESLTDEGVIGKYSTLYLNYYNGEINNYDFGYENNTTGETAVKMYMKMWFEGETMYCDFVSDKTSTATQLTIENWTDTSTYDSQWIVYSDSSNYRQSVEIESESFDTSKLPNLVYEIKIDKTRYAEIKRGDFIEAYYNETDYEAGGDLYGYDPRKLTRVVSVTIDSTNTALKVIKTDAPIKITALSGTTGWDYQTNAYPQVDTYANTYKGISLIPFSIRPDSLPNNTEARQSSILNVIDKNTNLAKGLANKNKISWRYLVDSFGLGLTEASKQQYADLCGMKLNCLGFINAPSVKTLKASTNPSFINDDRTLNTEYLKLGGDDTKNPSFLYTFAEGVGRSTVGYFFPYLTINDNGAPKDVPPAAWVATTYMRKFTTTQSGIQPWTICAGINDGRITNIAGAEMDFTDTDLENLYSMGLNPIVKKRNVGYCIETESTAQVFPYSSLSIIHSREVLIELENALYDMLLRYQWRFNTPEVRSEIKYRADKICKDIQDRTGLYDFRNVCDESNNTNYIIDLQMGVLDTFVEIVKGMGIIVNNITILKRGDIESGGFAQ